jgi:hypothetical protein
MIPALFPFVYSTANPNGGIGENELLPQFIPNVATDLCAFDVHVTSAEFTNETGADVTVGIRDKQTGRYLWGPSHPVYANSTVAFEFRGAFMPGGINWVASAANAITARMRVY